MNIRQSTTPQPLALTSLLPGTISFAGATLAGSTLLIAISGTKVSGTTVLTASDDAGNKLWEGVVDRTNTGNGYFVKRVYCPLAASVTKIFISSDSTVTANASIIEVAASA